MKTRGLGRKVGCGKGGGPATTGGDGRAVTRGKSEHEVGERAGEAELVEGRAAVTLRGGAVIVGGGAPPGGNGGG